MKWIVIILSLFIIPGHKPETVVKGYMKCIPFHTRTAIPILEDGLEKMSLTFVGQEQTSTKTLLISKVYESLKRAVSRKSHKRVDYDLRMLLKFYLSDGSKETFYIDWDKKGLLYKSQFYLIDKHEIDVIGKAFRCNYCHTGVRRTK